MHSVYACTCCLCIAGAAPTSLPPVVGSLLPLVPAATAPLLPSSSTSTKADRLGCCGADALTDETAADCFCSAGLAFGAGSGCFAAAVAVVSYAGDAGKLPEAGKPGLHTSPSQDISSWATWQECHHSGASSQQSTCRTAALGII